MPLTNPPPCKPSSSPPPKMSSTVARNAENVQGSLEMPLLTFPHVHYNPIEYLSPLGSPSSTPAPSVPMTTAAPAAAGFQLEPSHQRAEGVPVDQPTGGMPQPEQHPHVKAENQELATMPLTNDQASEVNRDSLPASSNGKKNSPEHTTRPHSRYSVITGRNGVARQLSKEERHERRRRFHKEHTKRSRRRMNEKVQRLLMSLPQPEREEDRPKCKPEVLEYAIGVIERILWENKRMKEHIGVLEAALGS